MNKKQKKLITYIAINSVLVIAIIVFVVKIISGKGKESDVMSQIDAPMQTEKLYAGEEVKEVVTINTKVIEDGLREMGTLITQEYYFTQVEEYTNTEKFWIFDSTASFTYSYDGVVAAGIDCSQITVVKDDEKKVITITIPKAEITSVTIDNDSFKKYEEKNGLWNKVTTDKFNDSMAAFKETAKNNAVAKGLLENADKSAEQMIVSFAKSVSTDAEYKIETVRK
ncbi:MAG: DUF4230 domain-containing protein [Lachnospiraceae bacterium]|nr:DUF4230 domain-containing protein [Lachnospiraceae bacterium]MBR5993177.1 DUF4230 domain-containing protein [Lachnospiraceae bacterium]